MILGLHIKPVEGPEFDVWGNFYKGLSADILGKAQYEYRCNGMVFPENIVTKEYQVDIPAEDLYQLFNDPDALSRRVAKPVVRSKTLAKDHRCPTCGLTLPALYGFTEYCWHCGQRLDWSETRC